ncbi:MAG: ABC transporter substrate-binding protein [Desulforhabdus sp.]|jgi:NitT/TauT family transport system substrate-binding protein|nr:ABC transporter substrate-binding protein [Desulforhabdus sp.]
MRRFFLIFMALVTVAIPAWFSLTPVWSAENEATITVGYIPIGDCLQLYVADEMGFFKEEGITVKKQSMKGGAVIAPAVESGEVQIGWSNAISIILAHTKDFDFVFLTSGALEREDGHRVHSLLVGKDSPIQNISDLKGKKVAINTLGNINELSMIVLADTNNVDIKQISLVEVPFPQMEAALKNGSVDAILAVEPFVTLSISHGTARYLEKSVHKSFGDEFMIGSWFAKKSWIEKNPSLTSAFVKAINRASDYIAANPAKMPEVLVKNTKLTVDLAQQIVLPAFSSKFEKSDLQKMIDVSATYEFIKAPFDADEIIYQEKTNE